MSVTEDDPDLDFPITRLIALYDYSYNDDDGHVVTMKQGDEYHLISKSGDWWEVVRDSGNTNDLTFYVPATYVKVLDDKDENSPRSEHSQEIKHDNNNDMSKPIKINTGSDNVKTEMEFAGGSTGFVHSNDVGITFGKVKGLKKMPESGTAISVTTVKTPFRRSYSDDGDYVNLDTYRQDAKIAEENDGESTDCVTHGDTSNQKKDYANISAIQQARNEPSSPDMEKSNYIKTLLDVWDMYHDPQTNRLFYINKDTQERTWKPPRHPDRQQRAQQILANIPDHKKQQRVANLNAKINRPAISIKPEIQVNPASLPNIPEGWSIEETRDGTVYINEETGEKWMSSINTEEKRYFYKVGSTETAWELPKTNWNSNVESVLPNPKTSPIAPRSNGRSPQIGRSLKSKSMFIESNINFQHTPHLPTSPPPRAQTLPNNLNTQAGGEPFSGNVNRAKILENNKKTKKNWIACYAKLSGSNLVFYKDAKSSKGVPGSPFGKSEFMIPLNGCSVNKNTKELSSKRNVIMIGTSHGDQFLVQTEDDKSAQKLFIQLEMKINELGHQPAEVFHSRNPSSASDSAEKSASWLQKFFSKRPTKESLEQKGIIKDALFGGDLKAICDKEKVKVPKFVTKCIVAIEKRGLEHDGIYRISGNQAHIQKLRCQVDQDKYDLDAKEWDVYTLTGALKLFFRELKEPLLTFNLFDKLVPALMKENSAERLKLFKENVHSLPKCNYETFKVLCHHLLKVIELCKENRMEVQNIAIVFGPTLIWPQHENNHCIATNMVYQSKIVEYCLLESKAIFK